MIVNKTLFLKNFVWYLSIVEVQGEKCAFWSFHNRTGISDENAKKVFEREHFAEVIHLTKQKLQDKFNVNLQSNNLALQN
jgi:hypothetical protein